MSSKELTFDFDYELLPENYSKFDLSFKLIVIGDSGVGKSCLTTQATKNVFEESYNATIGFEFFTFNIKLNGKIIKLQIWDTCGQELYRSLITNFYRNSSLAIIVYSVTERMTFENVDLWFKELRTHSSPNVKVFLIGNKIDLVDERKIQTEEGEKYAEQYKINKFNYLNYIFQNLKSNFISNISSFYFFYYHVYYLKHYSDPKTFHLFLDFFRSYHYYYLILYLYEILHNHHKVI